ncbi:hypothetical protein ACFQ88_22295 [Paenibacillus sp. NPDC056579]|uniref:hypothetical protein n=1 Tax=Paenibacillus sp. NPDC056579 TaxID=3345871 RepID=UPI0036828607
MNNPQKIQLLDGSVFCRTEYTRRCEMSGRMFPVFKDESDPSRTILLHDCGDWFNGEPSWLPGDEEVLFTESSEAAVRLGEGSTLVEEC